MKVSGAHQRSHRGLLFSILVSLVGLVGLWAMRPLPQASVGWGVEAHRVEMLARGTAAPAVGLPSVAGDTVLVGALNAERTAVVFVRPGCPHCERLGERLANGDGMYASRLLVVAGTGISGARAIKERYQLSASVLVDSSATASAAYSVVSVPSVYLIGPDGRIDKSAHGMPDSWELLQDL